MSLPEFDKFKDELTRAKRADQSWGDLLREIKEGSIKLNDNNTQAAKTHSAKGLLISLISNWDFFSSEHLDEAARVYEVKSWQVTEYIESLREQLDINESDLVVYEKTKPNISAGNTPTPSSTGSNESSLHDSQNLNPEVNPEADRVYYPAHQEDSWQDNHNSIVDQPSKTVLGLVALVSALAVILVALITSINSQKYSYQPPTAPAPSTREKSESSSIPAKPDNDSPQSRSDQVYFRGIDLPVTNKLCNKKGTFCIYNLATLVNQESGQATYTYSDFSAGQQVDITGTITVSNIERNGGSRNFTFAFRDDQSRTTPGWAAAGYFNLDQDSDPSKAGILTRFKTTESFGPKTPVGLENTAYLFPR